MVALFVNGIATLALLEYPAMAKEQSCLKHQVCQRIPWSYGRLRQASGRQGISNICNCMETVKVMVAIASISKSAWSAYLFWPNESKWYLTTEFGSSPQANSWAAWLMEHAHPECFSAWTVRHAQVIAGIGTTQAASLELCRGHRQTRWMMSHMTLSQ